MQTAQPGNLAKIIYTIKLESGQVVGSSKNEHPLAFKIGEGKVLKGLDQGIIGMHVGERRTLAVAPENAYGQRDEDLLIRVKRDQMPPDLELVVGRPIQYATPDGDRVNLMIMDVDETSVTLDANHPFAGQTLTFEIELLALA